MDPDARKPCRLRGWTFVVGTHGADHCYSGRGPSGIHRLPDASTRKRRRYPHPTRSSDAHLPAFRPLVFSCCSRIGEQFGGFEASEARAGPPQSDRENARGPGQPFISNAVAVTSRKQHGGIVRAASNSPRSRRRHSRLAHRMRRIAAIGDRSQIKKPLLKQCAHV